jgi:predicted RND superfamily exporter protein
MSLSRTVAHFVTHRRPLVFSLVALTVIACACVVIFALRFNSDILDMLPGKFDSVRSLKVSDREFTNARQLIFGIRDESGTLDLDEITARFAEEIKKEQWAVRVTAAPPLDSPDGIADLQKYLALPLLLNLPEADFSKALTALQPDRITERLHALREKMETPSVAEMKLSFDALGMVQEALKPVAGSMTSQSSQSFVSPDGTIHLVFVETNQDGIGPHECQALMRRVEAFEKKFLANYHPAPAILVTGRTAYVDQISRDMRFDILSTLAGSIVLVSAVFYFGFRRFMPLFALMHVLLLCCVIAIAIGGLIFHELNLITIGLCSILVGLGVDFGMLLYGSYQSQRNAGIEHELAIHRSLRQLGGGIFVGALTTAAAFVSLVLSDCAAFAQFGVLIAFGILFASVLMMTVFYACVSRKRPPQEHDFLFEGGKKYVRVLFRNPKPVLIGTTILLVGLSLYAVAPVGQLRMEADPKSMEPKCAASTALHTIQDKFPIAHDPVVILVSANNPDEFRHSWELLQARWTKLAANGEIKGFRSFGAFALSPSLMKKNLARLNAADIGTARATLTATLKAEDFNANDDAFQNSFALLEALQKAVDGNPPGADWHDILPHSSSWWFALDQFFAKKGLLGAAYITPAEKIQDSAQKEALRDKIIVEGVSMHITGWTYVLADLIPWAKSKLMLLTVVMVAFNIVLLAFLYRKFAPLAILMLSLALSVGSMVACLKIFGFALNLFNVLAFPLVLGVGVDYGIYILLALRQPGDKETGFATIIKPVVLAGLTAIAGFGSLALAHNPALRGLGIVCALGVAWSLFSTLFFILPAYLWRKEK